MGDGAQKEIKRIVLPEQRITATTISRKEQEDAIARAAKARGRELTLDEKEHVIAAAVTNKQMKKEVAGSKIFVAMAESEKKRMSEKTVPVVKASAVGASTEVEKKKPSQKVAAAEEK